MEPDKTDDPMDTDYEVKSNGRGVWTPVYLRKFTKLLSDNTVVLQSLLGYTRDDPIQDLKKRALEQIRLELDMTTTDQVRARIVTFKKFAANKLRQCMDKFSPTATPEHILKVAPRWLRDLEPHLNLWAQMESQKSKRSHRRSPPNPPTHSAPPSTPSPPESEGTRLALALVESARALRTLEARAVCKKVNCVPNDKRDDLQHLWWRMLDVVRQKLSLQRDAGDSSLLPSLALSPQEALCADLVLLLDDSICTACDLQPDNMQAQVSLFHLVQRHGLQQESVSPDNWRQAHREYRVQDHIAGGFSSLILMQRRWHEMKIATRQSFTNYSRGGSQGKPPVPLHAAIARRFPSVMTTPLRSWREMVDRGEVVEDDNESSYRGAQQPTGRAGQTVPAPTGQLLQSKDDEDDLIVIEKEIETIDLINGMDEHGVGQNNAHQQLEKANRENIALELEEDLQKQLQQFQKEEVGSHISLLMFQEKEPRGMPTFIYEDEDEDIVACTEDRNRNIELIASQINSEEANVNQIAQFIKNEVDKVGTLSAADSDEHGLPSPTPCPSGKDNDGVEEPAIDEKLLMDAQINLERIDSIPQWRRFAKRNSIRVSCLPSRLSAKRAKLQPVTVKIENVDDDRSTGQRQVKSIAMRLISEMMRDDGEAPRDNDESEDVGRVAKKVQLPNIEQVRKTNMNMLTAQVAPLSSDGFEEAGSGNFTIDLSNEEVVPSSDVTQADDLTLSWNELEEMLKRLTEDRSNSESTPKTHCCTARRQRALNSARSRVAVRAGRNVPVFMNIHASSACSRQETCTCCCKHLLEEEDSSDRLLKETKDIDAAFARLVGGEENLLRDGGTRVTNKNAKKSKKKNDVPETSKSEQVSDPLQEWIRQKNLNQKYFNLNLKMKPQTPLEPPLVSSESRSEPKPPLQVQESFASQVPSGSRSLPKSPLQNPSPTVKTRLVPAPRNNVGTAPKPTPSPVGGHPSDATPPVTSAVTVPVTSTPQQTRVYAGKVRVTSAPILKVVPGSKVVSVPFGKTQVNFTSINNTIASSSSPITMVTTPSKQLPGGTLVKLSTVLSNRAESAKSAANQGITVSNAGPKFTLKKGSSTPPLVVDTNKTLPNYTKVVKIQKGSPFKLVSAYQKSLLARNHITNPVRIAPKIVSEPPPLIVSEPPPLSLIQVQAKDPKPVPKIDPKTITKGTVIKKPAEDKARGTGMKINAITAEDRTRAPIKHQPEPVQPKDQHVDPKIAPNQPVHLQQDVSEPIHLADLPKNPLAESNDLNEEKQDDGCDSDTSFIEDIITSLENDAEESISSHRSNAPTCSDQIDLPQFKRGLDTNTYRCIYSSCPNTELAIISEDLRIMLVIDEFFYVPRQGRICMEHLISNNWDSLFNAEESSSFFTREQIEHVFSFVKSTRANAINFNSTLNIDEHLFMYWIGLNKKTFNNLIEETPRIRTINQSVCALMALLIQYRHGYSNTRIGDFMHLAKRTLKAYMAQARDILLEDLVPKYLGIEHKSREKLLEHNLWIPNGVLENNAHPIIVCDSIYISNFQYQKKQNSKIQNLIKYFLLVLTDGYILDCFGPFVASTSDDKIIKKIFNEAHSPLRQYFRPGDIFLLDKNSRDSVDTLQKFGYRPFAPESKPFDQQQLSTQQANLNRCITLCRRVTKAVSDQIKQDFKLLGQLYHHTTTPNVPKDFKICAALYNKFAFRHKNPSNAQSIIDLIIERRHRINNLADFVEAENLNNRTGLFEDLIVDGTNVDFPTLEEKDFLLFALGSNHLEVAYVYYKAHILINNGFKISVCIKKHNIDMSKLNINEEQTTLFRVKVKARNLKKKGYYYVYILTKNKSTSINGILEYYCDCNIGRRTLGCCAHVMTVVWFLGWARRQKDIPAYAHAHRRKPAAEIYALT